MIPVLISSQPADFFLLILKIAIPTQAPIKETCKRLATYRSNYTEIHRCDGLVENMKRGSEKGESERDREGESKRERERKEKRERGEEEEEEDQEEEEEEEEEAEKDEEEEEGNTGV